MSRPKELMHLTTQEVRKFLNSFDVILLDCDGVIWFGYNPIKNVAETITWLLNNGKKVIFVSNNSTQELSKICEHFSKMGLEIDQENFVNPAVVINWYLKKVNFHGDAFVIGTSALVNSLSKAGIGISEPCPNVLPESVPVLLDIIRKRPPVKAVIVDFDINCNWIKLDLALEYLKENGVHFITGSLDTTVILSADLELLGQGPICKILTELSGRQPIKCGKPSTVLKEYIFQKYDLCESERTLFVGDSLCHDMEFGAMCGFQKLFVGSGVDKLESVGRICEVIPDYYLPTLGHLWELIKKCENELDLI